MEWGAEAGLEKRKRTDDDMGEPDAPISKR